MSIDEANDLEMNSPVIRKGCNLRGYVVDTCGRLVTVAEGNGVVQHFTRNQVADLFDLPEELAAIGGAS